MSQDHAKHGISYGLIEVVITCIPLILLYMVYSHDGEGVAKFFYNEEWLFAAVVLATQCLVKLTEIMRIAAKDMVWRVVLTLIVVAVLLIVCSVWFALNHKPHASGAETAAIGNSHGVPAIVAFVISAAIFLWINNAARNLRTPSRSQ